MNEQNLWISFRKGDKIAFGKIFTLYYKDLYRYGRKLDINPSALDDNIQDLFLDLWQRKTQLPEVISVKGYLFKSLKFKLLKSIRNNVPIDQINVDAEDYFEFSYESNLIIEQQKNEDFQKLLDGIQQLPPRQQEALYLKYNSQLDYEEISEMMGISKQAVINLIYKSVRFLREHLSSYLSVWAITNLSDLIF